VVTCTLCDEPNAEAFPNHLGRSITQVACSACGTYNITSDAISMLKQERWREQRHLLAAIAYQSRAADPPELTTAGIADLLDSVALPGSLLTVLDRLLLLIHDRLPDITRPAVLEKGVHYLFFLRNAEDLKGMLNKLQEMGLVTWAPTSAGLECTLTIEGWKQTQRLRSERPHSAKAFVAMSFEPGMDAAWSNGFVPALRAAGWEPIRMKELEHNDKICDRILAEIRSAGLLVADFTSHRAGVYFEAGFAAGLGITVIWTVRESDLDKTHFDTRQYNHIVWVNHTDLKAKLLARILATVKQPSGAAGDGQLNSREDR
jgi:hypothetical protein